MAPIARGADGSAKVGSTDIGKVTEWEYDEETTVEESGPWVGEDVIEETPAGDKYSLKIKVEVPEGGNPGQDELIAARGSKARKTITLTTTKAKVITMTNGLIKKASVKNAAKGKQEIEFEISGTGAITQAPSS